MTRAFHMVSLELDLMRVLQDARVTWDVADHGYSVHCALAALFGDTAPRPFAPAETTGRWLRLVGYTRASAAELKEHADSFSEPQTHAACAWDRLATKPMPTFSAGTSFGFELRACPVTRLAREVEDPGERTRARHPRRTYAKGSELDAFQAQRLGGDLETPRDLVYRRWLEKRLDTGGAELVTSEVSRFALARLWRRPQQGSRKGSRLVRPDVSFRGVLRVADPKRFTDMLRAGVGRHAAFGFGMLLLRPPPAHAQR